MALQVAGAEVSAGTRLTSMPFWALWRYRVRRQAKILQTNGRAAGSIAYELAYAARGTFQMPGCTSRTSGVPSSALGTSQVRSPRMLLVASPWQCPDEIPVTPTVRLSMDVETFTCLGCGRWTPEAAVKAGKVQMTGATVLGQTIPAQMSIII